MTTKQPANRQVSGRDSSGRILPGTSLNPEGRPKVDVAFRARARKAVDDRVLDRWIAELENDGPEWVKCSELLAAYGYGKPSQAVEISTMAEEQWFDGGRLDKADVLEVLRLDSLGRPRTAAEESRLFELMKKTTTPEVVEKIGVLMRIAIEKTNPNTRLGAGWSLEDLKEGLSHLTAAKSDSETSTAE